MLSAHGQVKSWPSFRLELNGYYLRRESLSITSQIPTHALSVKPQVYVYFYAYLIHILKTLRSTGWALPRLEPDITKYSPSVCRLNG